MRRVPGRRRRRPQAKRTRCQKSLKLNICQLQTASSDAQKSNTKFAIIQNWRWRKKPLVSGLLFRIFFVGLLFFQLARLAGLRARTLRCAACGLRLAICLIYFLNWCGRISICASCRSRSATALRDMIKCPSVCTEKRESSHNLTSNFPLARNDNGASSLSLSPSRPWRVPRVASSFGGSSCGF